MAGMTTTTLDDLVVAATASCRFYTNQKAILKNYVTPFAIPRMTVTVPIIGNATVINITEGTDATGTSNLATSGATITASQKAVRDYVSDLVELESAEDLGILIGKAFGKAISSNINQSIFALFDGFSNTVGTSNTDLTLDVIREAKFVLEKNGASEDEMFLAITPHVHEDLVTAIMDSTAQNLATIIANDVYTRGAVKNILGIEVLIVSDLAGTTGAGEKDAADIKCGLFTREALAYNEVYPFRIEKQRDASMIGWELVGSIAYGVAELNDDFGVEILCDNADA